MNLIEFTQYLMPDGRKRPVAINVSDEVAERALEIRNAGYVFECEMLSTGMVSLTITDPNEGDMVCEVVKNGPSVQNAVENMILKFVLPEHENF